MRRIALSLALAALLAGCGNERQEPPDVRTPSAPDGGERPVRYEDAGVRLKAPNSWRDLQPQGSRIGGIQSGLGTLAIWRYPRSEPLPAGKEALEEVEDLLVERIKQRNPTFQLRSSRLTRRGGARGIELLGEQEIAGLPYEVRSSHLFAHGAEIVVDAYAPPEEFARVDRTIFEPVLRSLRVSEP